MPKWIIKILVKPALLNLLFTLFGWKIFFFFFLIWYFVFSFGLYVSKCHSSWVTCVKLIYKLWRWLLLGSLQSKLYIRRVLANGCQAGDSSSFLSEWIGVSTIGKWCSHLHYQVKKQKLLALASGCPISSPNHSILPGCQFFFFWLEPCIHTTETEYVGCFLFCFVFLPHTSNKHISWLEGYGLKNRLLSELLLKATDTASVTSNHILAVPEITKDREIRMCLDQTGLNVTAVCLCLSSHTSLENIWAVKWLVSHEQLVWFLGLPM